MTRLQEFHNDVKNATLKAIKDNCAATKTLCVELCNDLSESQFAWSWIHNSCIAGLEKEFIKKLGLQICKKSEATSQMIIGEKIDGMFLRGKSKNYWLKPL